MDKPGFPEQTDIAIVGAGLTGLCLALLLARQQPSWNILLLDGSSTVTDVENADHPGNTDQASPSGFDHRQIVLAESSHRILSHTGVWPDIHKQSAAITEIRVSDRGHIGHSQLSAGEQELDAYGYVIDAAALASLFSTAIEALSNVQMITIGDESVFTPVADGMVVREGANSVRARLVLLANGVAPLQAKKLGIQFHHKDYGCCALTAELTLGQAHGGIAYERFTPDGPIALLPLANMNGLHRASLVWTLPLQQAEHLLAADEDLFIEELMTCFGQRAGPVTGVSRRVMVPLARTVAAEQVRSHLVLMGSAAHSLHPVAGQGFNLTLRDIATLCEVLSKSESSHHQLGDLASLQDYQQRRQGDQDRVVAFSDVLPGLFANNNPLLAVGRNLALMGLDLAPELRATVARFGAGLATREARIHD